MRQPALYTIVTLVLGATAAWAQTGRPQADPNNPWQPWNVEQMIQRATSQVVKRYGLTAEQEEFTRRLMVDRVNAFLDGHETEIRQLFTEAMAYQMQGSPPPAEKVQEWTQRIDPLFDEAKRSIIDGNHEFRTVLNDEQKQIHDIDLRVMEQNFKDVNRRLDRWREGGFDPEKDFGMQPGQTQREPRREPAPVAPKGPEQGQRPAWEPGDAPPPTVEATPVRPFDRRERVIGPPIRSQEVTADFWDMYVQRFIARYQLDDAQAGQALAILADSKKRATEYRAARKEEFERVQEKLGRARRDTANQQEMAETYKLMQELNKPVNDLFQEMRDRLENIPSEAQRKTAEENARTLQAQRLERARRAGSTQPASASQPAATRPTATQPLRTATRPTATQLLRATTQPATPITSR